jgi:hypothetical protein
MSREVELTPELVDLHERLRSEGVPIADCCRIAGHSVSVWYRWKAEAEAVIRHRDLFAELVKAMGGQGSVDAWLAGEADQGAIP